MIQVGVLYVSNGQVNNEQEILRNTTGSLRYTEFLQVRINIIYKIFSIIKLEQSL